MICPDLHLNKRKKIYSVKPYISPRLTNSIFSYDKNELIEYTNNNHHMIKEFIEALPENFSLIDIYKNINDLSLSSGRRAIIKNWLDNHGAHFYSLSILHNYYWIKEIGKGSFSSAQLIKENETNDFRVVKITEDKKFKTANKSHFLREMENLKSINHPYIIKLYKWGIEENKLWSVNDYGNLGSLDHYINNSTYIDLPIRLRFLDHTIEALTYIHSKNIIHRDIKPANIILFGEIINIYTVFKIGDFNLSKQVVGNDIHSFCGTSKYMAPELFTSTDYDYKVDIWSLLCVLIDIITPNPINLMKENPFSRLWDACSPCELELIDLMHKKDPHKRISSSDLLFYYKNNKPKQTFRRSRSFTIDG